MKKFIFFISLIFVVIVFSTIGYQVVSANEMISETKSIIEIQNGKEEFFSSYGYTIDNPNIIVNPYDISPLTALIMFETDKEVSVSVMVVGKNDETSFYNTFSKEKKHYIPVYGLYPNYENKVILSYEDIQKEYTIKTESLPNDFVLNNIESSDALLFVNDSIYPYAVDKNNEVRWFLTKKFFGSINRLLNGNFLLGGEVVLANGFSKDILELDLLGKIYYQYSVKDGYYGSFANINSRLFVLSNNLLEIDKQSGVVLNTIKLDGKYDFLTYQPYNNSIELYGDNNISINVDSFKISSISSSELIENRVVSSNFYLDNKEYKIIPGIKFSNHFKTKEAKKRIFLVGYKKIDDEYLRYNIKFKKNDDYLKISGNFNNGDEVYIILEQFLNKKIYAMKDKQLIIHNGGLNGKYVIYVKINDTIYKTNQCVSF